MEAGTAPSKTQADATAAGGVPGPGLGFSSLEHEVRIDSVPVEGEIPAWLQGSLLRTGPAKFEAGEHAYRHWFDGQAMLHRFGIGAGTVSYASRFLRGKAYDAAAEGKIEYSEFATDPCRGLFKRVMSIFDPKLSDNANVNLTQLGERYIAMTETPIPVQFDAETLDTVGVAYEVPGMLTTAHPHLDRASGGMLNYAAKLGPAQRVPVLPSRPGREQAGDRRLRAGGPPRLHALVRAQRALADPRRVPVRRRPEADHALRQAVHRELRVASGARHEGDAVRPPRRQPRRPVRD